MPAAPAISRPDWTDVLTDLVGLRLAVYDELLRGGVLGRGQMAARIGTAEAKREGALEAALAWLAHHRLVTSEGGGRWAHRGMREASRIYAERGPDAEHPLPSGGSLAAEERRGDRRECGAHVGARAEAAGGHTFSQDHQPPTPPAPKPAVHFSGLLDFGDY